MRSFFVFFFLINSAIFAQDYSLVDAKVKRYPTYSSAQQLATKINADFKTDTDKIRAVFIWLTENIRYDLEEYYRPSTKQISFQYKNEAEKQLKLQQIKDQIADETFKNKKSVCEGYAQSFKKICDLLTIEAVIIKGYARNSSDDIGTIATTTNHAWNAVKVDSTWQLVDATWAAGYEINNQWKKHFTEYYFFPNPTELLRSHLPESAAWQLVQNRISKADFSNQPVIGQGFFSENLELISPKKGIISKAKNKEFKILKLQTTEIGRAHV